MLPTISRRRDRPNDFGDVEENQPFISNNDVNNNIGNMNNPLININNGVNNGVNNNLNNNNNANNLNNNNVSNNAFFNLSLGNLQNFEPSPMHQVYAVSLCFMCCIGCVCSFWVFISIAQIIALSTEWNKKCDTNLQSWLLTNLLLPIIFAFTYLSFLLLIHLLPTTCIAANNRRRYRILLQKVLSNRTEVFIYSFWILQGYHLWKDSKTCSDTAPVLYYMVIFTIWISTMRLCAQFILQCCVKVCGTALIAQLRNQGLIDPNMGNQQSIEQIYRNLLLNPLFAFSRGTPENIIDELRTEAFDGNNIDIESGNGNNDGDRSCAICLATFENGEQLRYLPCNHSFHCECIDQWLRAHRTCPMCRIDVVSSR